MAEEDRMEIAAGTGRQTRLMGRRAFVGGSLAASTLALLAACGKKDEGGASGSAGGSGTGGTLSFYVTNPVSIDPYNCQETHGAQICHQLFDSLTKFDFDKEQLVGSAAEKWEANDDATEFTFTIKKGCTFHNGEKVTAQCFKRGWERMTSPNSEVAKAYSPGEVSYHLAYVEGYDDLAAGKATEFSGVTCPDDYTLKVKLTKPFADFPYVCMHPALSPVPGAAEKDAKNYFLAPIGNGPFQMDGKWEDGQQIKLKRYDDYKGGDVAKLDGLLFSIQKDMETAFKEFQAGNLDICQSPVAQLANSIKQYKPSDDGYNMDADHHMLTGAQVATYFIVCNNASEPFNNADLRRGISLAINRQAIVDTLYQGIRKVAGGILPPGVKGYRENAWKYCKYDVDEAKKYLDKVAPAGADGSRGINVTLTYNQDGGHKEIMESVIGDLQKVGITVTSDTPEWSAALTQYHDGKFQFGRSGWTADYPIMDNFLYPLFDSASIGGDNFAHYSNPAFDQAMTEARATVDDDERIKKLQVAEDIVSEDIPVIPIMYYSHDYVGSDRVKAFYMSPMLVSTMEDAELSA